MKTHRKSILLRYLLPVIILVALTFAFRHNQNSKKPITHPRDYPAIAEEGILRVATEYNSISFHINEDTSLIGFHYELIEAFAHDMGLKAKITPVMSYNERLNGLNEGKFDVIAYGIPATSEIKNDLLLTSPVALNRQVLVQRKKSGKNDSIYIKSQLDLAGKTLYVVKGSPTILRIQNLSNEIGDTIYTKEIEKYGPEQLIALVAHGDINYAVCDESIAHAIADSLPQIDSNTAISFTQFYSWAVSKQSQTLLDSLNTWLYRFRQKGAYQKIYQKYYD